MVDISELLPLSASKDVSKRVEAYRSLTEKLSALPQSTEWGHEMSADLAKQIVSNLRIDLLSDGEDVSLPVTGFLGYFLANEKLMDLLTVEEEQQVLESLIKLLEETKEKSVLTRGLWSLAQSKFECEIYSKNISKLLTLIIDILKCDPSVIISYEILQVMKSLIESIPNEIIDKAEDWVPNVIAYLFHDSLKIRGVTYACLNFCQTLNQQENRSLHFNQYFAAAIPLLKSEYCKQMTKFVEENCTFVLKIWRLLVIILGRDLHSGTTLINGFLEVVEKAFKSSKPEFKVDAFKCWHTLIGNFSTDIEVLSHPRRLKLLIAPLKANNAKTEDIAYIKLHTWWGLVCKLKAKRVDYFDLIIVPLLKFCFNSNRVLQSGVNERTLLMSGAPSPCTKYPNLLLKSCEVLAFILSSEEIRSAFSYSFLLQDHNYQIVTPALFLKNSTLILGCVADSLISLNSSDKKHFDIGLIILQSTMKYVNSVVNENLNKKESIELVKEVFSTYDFLEGQTKRGDSLTLFAYELIKMTTIGDFSFSRNVLNSRHYHISVGTKMRDIMHGTLSNYLIHKLCKPALLHFSTTTDSGFLDLWLAILQKSTPSNKLVFIQTVMEELELLVQYLCPQSPEILLSLWTGAAKLLDSYIEETQQINQGDNSEADWTCVYNTLLFPLNISENNMSTISVTTYEDLIMNWTSLWYHFTSLTALDPTAEPNCEAEYVVKKVLGNLKGLHPTSGFSIALFSNIVYIIVEKFKFKELGKKPKKLLQSPLKPRRKPHPLHNLSAVIDVLNMLMEKTLRMVSQWRQKAMQWLARSFIKIFANISQDRMVWVTVAAVLDVMKKALQINPSAMFTLDVERTVVSMWNSFCGLIECRVATKLTKDQLASLSPLICVALQSSHSGIRQRTRLMWSTSFASTAHTIPAELFDVLKTAGLPPASISETPLEESQSLSPKENIPTHISGSFLNREKNQEFSPFSSAKIQLKEKPSPLSAKSPLSNKSPKGGNQTRNKFSIDDLKAEDFVMVSSPKVKKRVLTPHQVEKMRERASDIPALYNDMSQSVSQLPPQFMSQESFDCSQNDSLSSNKIDSSLNFKNKINKGKCLDFMSQVTPEPDSKETNESALNKSYSDEELNEVLRDASIEMEKSFSDSVVYLDPNDKSPEDESALRKSKRSKSLLTYTNNGIIVNENQSPSPSKNSSAEKDCHSLKRKSATPSRKSLEDIRKSLKGTPNRSRSSELRDEKLAKHTGSPNVLKESVSDGAQLEKNTSSPKVSVSDDAKLEKHTSSPKTLNDFVSEDSKLSSSLTSPSVLLTSCNLKTDSKSPHSSPVKLKSPTHSPTKSKSPIHSPTKSKSPIHSPTKSKSPIHSPTKSKSPIHSPTKSKSPIHSPTKSKDSEPKNKTPTKDENTEAESEDEIPSSQMETSTTSTMLLFPFNSPKISKLSTRLSLSSPVKERPKRNKRKSVFEDESIYITPPKRSRVLSPQKNKPNMEDSVIILEDECKSVCESPERTNSSDEDDNLLNKSKITKSNESVLGKMDSEDDNESDNSDSNIQFSTKLKNKESQAKQDVSAKDRESPKDSTTLEPTISTPSKITRSGRRIVAPKKDMPEPMTPPGSKKQPEEAHTPKSQTLDEASKGSAIHKTKSHSATKNASNKENRNESSEMDSDGEIKGVKPLYGEDMVVEESDSSFGKSNSINSNKSESEKEVNKPVLRRKQNSATPVSTPKSRRMSLRARKMEDQPKDTPESEIEEETPDKEDIPPIALVKETEVKNVTPKKTNVSKEQVDVIKNETKDSDCEDKQINKNILKGVNKSATIINVSGSSVTSPSTTSLVFVSPHCTKDSPKRTINSENKNRYNVIFSSAGINFGNKDNKMSSSEEKHIAASGIVFTNTPAQGNLVDASSEEKSESEGGLQKSKSLEKLSPSKTSVQSSSLVFQKIKGVRNTAQSTDKVNNEAFIKVSSPQTDSSRTKGLITKVCIKDLECIKLPSKCQSSVVEENKGSSSIRLTLSPKKSNFLASDFTLFKNNKSLADKLGSSSRAHSFNKSKTPDKLGNLPKDNLEISEHKLNTPTESRHTYSSPKTTPVSIISSPVRSSSVASPKILNWSPQKQASSPSTSNKKILLISSPKSPLQKIIYSPNFKSPFKFLSPHKDETDKNVFIVTKNKTLDTESINEKFQQPNQINLVNELPKLIKNSESEDRLKEDVKTANKVEKDVKTADEVEKDVKTANTVENDVKTANKVENDVQKPNGLEEIENLIVIENDVQNKVLEKNKENASENILKTGKLEKCNNKKEENLQETKEIEKDNKTKNDSEKKEIAKEKIKNTKDIQNPNEIKEDVKKSDKSEDDLHKLNKLGKPIKDKCDSSTEVIKISDCVSNEKMEEQSDKETSPSPVKSHALNEEEEACLTEDVQMEGKNSNLDVEMETGEEKKKKGDEEKDGDRESFEEKEKEREEEEEGQKWMDINELEERDIGKERQEERQRERERKLSKRKRKFIRKFSKATHRTSRLSRKKYKLIGKTEDKMFLSQSENNDIENFQLDKDLEEIINEKEIKIISEKESPDKNDSKLTNSVSTPERKNFSVMKVQIPGSRAAIMLACAKRTMRTRADDNFDSLSTVRTSEEGLLQQSPGITPSRKRPYSDVYPDGKPWAKHEPSPGASPCGSILKKRQVEDECLAGILAELSDQAEGSPSTKNRRVSFADPPVSESVEIPPSPKILKGHKAQKRLDMTQAIAKGFTIIENSQNSQDWEMSLDNPSCSQPLYSPLITSSDSIDLLAPLLTSSSLVESLKIVFKDRGIKTIGEFCAMSEMEVQSFPVRSPKLVNAIKSINKYEETLQTKREEVTATTSNDESDLKEVSPKKTDVDREEEPPIQAERVCSSAQDILIEYGPDIESKDEVDQDAEKSESTETTKDDTQAQNKEESSTSKIKECEFPRIFVDQVERDSNAVSSFVQGLSLDTRLKLFESLTGIIPYQNVIDMFHQYLTKRNAL